MFLRHYVGAGVAFFGLAGAAGAQACTIPPSEQSVPGVIRATLRSIGSHTPPVGYTAAVLEAIGQQYPADSSLALHSYVPTADSGMAAATAFTVVAFTVTDSASLDDMVRVASSQSPDFDHNVVRALRAAGKAGLPRVPKAAGGSVRFELDAEAMPVADTVTRVADQMPDDETRTVRMAWAATTLPVWSHAVPAGMAPGTAVPKYPEVAKRHGDQERVVVQYVVNADGRVVPGSTFLKRATYKDFVESVSQWLPTVTFYPAKIDGCPVPEVITLPSSFVVK